VVLAAAIGVAQATLIVTAGRYSENRVVNELAMNGVYSFFNAALNSELDFTCRCRTTKRTNVFAR
jgi:hypothetical protein